MVEHVLDIGFSMDTVPDRLNVVGSRHDNGSS